MIVPRISSTCLAPTLARRPWSFAPLVALGLAGCGDSAATTRAEQVFPVRGKVLLANEKPLKGGRIIFMPTKGSTHAALGQIGPDGAFSLTTAEAGEGAEPGEYRVRVEPLEESLPRGKPGARSTSLARYPFPIKYNDEDSSGLIATVRPESNSLDPFRLK